VSPCRILVTGATGFVGKHLLPTLAGQFPGAAVLAPGFDVTDPAATETAIRKTAPDAIVHLAAVAAIPAAQRNANMAWQVNLLGTLTVARTLRAVVPDALLLWVGSADAYGASFRAGKLLDEAAPLAPLNTYGATKAAADLALGAMAAEGLHVVRVRPFNHTGPGQSPSFVVAAFARQIARIAAGLQPPVLNVGDLEPRRDFLDVRDVCAAYAAILERADTLPAGTVLNIASGVPRRIGDVLSGLLHRAGVQAEVQTDAARMRSTDIPLALGDAGLARAVLEWAPGIAWGQTLSDVLEDWQARVAAGQDSPA
jgi:GDP-4-dehydro-6-deoxy-D-mannose reductase